MNKHLAPRLPSGRLFRSIVAASCTAILAACSSTPPIPYALPDGIPSANLRSVLVGASGRHESISVWMSGALARGLGSGNLFDVRSSKSKPEGYVKVPANEEITLVYFEMASGNRTCNIAIKTVLEAGKNYSLEGGFAYEEGVIPILFGTRKCRLGVIDDATRLPVPLRSGK
ncbi:hypothetical protein WIX39_010340 [Variovorax sp. AB1(2024)]|uniref:hypothetical protein n=1 Tax=Variovorax sp. AB1(2024) TaxID=3132214 RepID=UPI0030952525